MVKRLRKMSFFICASPKYLKKFGKPNTLEDIEHHNCLLFLRTNNSVNWLFKDKKGKVVEIKVKGKYLLTNSLAIKQCAISGMGLALLPDWLIDYELLKTINLYHKLNFATIIAKKIH